MRTHVPAEETPSVPVEMRPSLVLDVIDDPLYRIRSSQIVALWISETRTSVLSSESATSDSSLKRESIGRAKDRPGYSRT